MVALNPLEQLAKVRDAGREQTTGTLGHTMEAYGVSNGGVYINETVAGGAENNTWMTDLQSAGELSTVPGSSYPGYNSVVTCNGAAIAAQTGFCYDATAGGAGAGATGPVIIFSRLEALSNINKCQALLGAGAANVRAFAIYSTALGKGGVACTSGNTNPTVATGYQSGTNWLP